MDSKQPSPLTARHHPGGGLIRLINCLFTMSGSLAVTLGLRAITEALDLDEPGLLLLILLVWGWVGGYMALTGWHARLWDRGRRRLVVRMAVGEAVCVPLLFAAGIALQATTRTDPAFHALATDYMALTPADMPEADERIRGQCVIVEDFTGAPEVSIHLMETLPRPIRARSPDEVKSVVQLRWGRRTLPTPDGAWVETCALIVLDADTRQVVARRSFTGTWREVQQKGRGKYWAGYLPRDEVTTYLRELRRVP